MREITISEFNMSRKKKSKYGNKKVEIDGLIFDSKKEGSHYMVLKALQRQGTISELRTQVSMDIVIGSKKIARYIADFTYIDSFGKLHVEDVKSPITRKNPVYRLKKKLIEAIYQIEIEEF